jgi:predicted nucleic acid-binding protein
MYTMTNIAFSQKISLKDTTHFKIIANNQFFKGNTIFSKQKKDPKAIPWVFLYLKVATCLTTQKWIHTLKLRYDLLHFATI